MHGVGFWKDSTKVFPDKAGSVAVESAYTIEPSLDSLGYRKTSERFKTCLKQFYVDLFAYRQESQQQVCTCPVDREGLDRNKVTMKTTLLKIFMAWKK